MNYRNATISAEPTGLPSGGWYARVDGLILGRRQGNRYARVFLTEQRALIAARAFVRENAKIDAAVHEGLIRAEAVS